MAHFMCVDCAPPSVGGTEFGRWRWSGSRFVMKISLQKGISTDFSRMFWMCPCHGMDAVSGAVRLSLVSATLRDAISARSLTTQPRAFVARLGSSVGCAWQLASGKPEAFVMGENESLNDTVKRVMLTPPARWRFRLQCAANDKMWHAGHHLSHLLLMPDVRCILSSSAATPKHAHTLQCPTRSHSPASRKPPRYELQPVSPGRSKSPEKLVTWLSWTTFVQTIISALCLQL